MSDPNISKYLIAGIETLGLLSSVINSDGIPGNMSLDDQYATYQQGQHQTFQTNAEHQLGIDAYHSDESSYTLDT